MERLCSSGLYRSGYAIGNSNWITTGCAILYPQGTILPTSGRGWDTTAIEDIEISMRYIDIPLLLSFFLPVDDDVSAVLAVGSQVSVRLGRSAVSTTTIALYSGKTKPLAVGNFNSSVFDIGIG